MKTISILTGALALLCIFSAPLTAATILTGKTVRVSAPIDGNVYAGAGEIYINAPIRGDLTAGAGELQLRDTVHGDLIAGGGRVRIEGVVGDDLRCGGGEVRLFGEVFGDVLVGSGRLEISRGAVIHGDLVIGGGEVQVYGQVLGSVIIAGGTVVLDGEVAQSAKLRGGEFKLEGIFRGPCEIAAGHIALGDKAEFHQNVRYWQRDGELDFSKQLRGEARATFDTNLKQGFEEQEGNWASRGFSFFSLYRLLAGALLITVLLLLFEGFFRTAAEGLPQQWLQRLGSGVLYLIGVPVGIVLLLITVIGIPFGLFGLFFYLFTLVFAPALTATVGANALEQYRQLSWSKGQRILVAIGLLAALRLIAWIPLIGWLAVFVLVAVAFGCLWRATVGRA